MTASTPDVVDVLGKTHKNSFSMARAAKLAATSTCPTAMTSAVTGLETARLVEGTDFHDPARVPAAARGRGAALERMLRDNEYAHVIRLAREHFGFDVVNVIPANLRIGYPPNSAGMVRRAAATRQHLEAWLRGDPDAANFLDGAVIAYEVGGRKVYAEADVLGLVVGGTLRLFEIKSKQLVNGQLVGGPNRGWKLQMTMYLVLVRALLDEIAADLRRQGITAAGGGELVSTDALLVVSKGTGLYPLGLPLDLRDDIAMAELTLERLNDVDAASALTALEKRLWPANLPTVVDDATKAARAELVGEILDALGHDFGPHCLGNCDLYKLCRDRNAGRLASVDRSLVRAAGPELPTFAQVVSIARRPQDAPTAAAVPAAALGRAAQLDELADRLAGGAP